MLELTVAEAGESASLEGAILLYGAAKDRSITYCTVHDVKPVAGRPTIQAGRLMNQNDLMVLVDRVASARSALETSWLDAKVVAKGPDRLVWWTPECRRAMFFEKSTYNKSTFDGHAQCPLPAMVWMAIPKVGLYVYALSENHRPTPDSPLFQAPLFNIWGNGKVCLGSAVAPPADRAGDPHAWEETLFGSRFTHPNFTEANRLTKGINPVAFWRAMVAKPARKFPGDRLVRIPLVAGDLATTNVLDRLNKLPKPKGEF